jgi:hypothetical protein
MMKDEGAALVVAGGFVRDAVARVTPRDIDVFGADEKAIKRLAESYRLEKGASQHGTEKAVTILPRGELPVQFVFRWTFAVPHDVVEHFDFSTAAAAVWYDGLKWASACDDRFYADLASRRLTYTEPPEPDACGSLLRALRFVGRGHHIPRRDLIEILANAIPPGLTIGQMREHLDKNLRGAYEDENERP